MTFFKSNSHMRVAVTGLAVNLALSGLKIFAGLFGRSRAVLADGVHSLSDVVTDIGVIFSAGYCTEPADRRHPYGHGRMDILISLGIALFMAVAGVSLFITSAGDLRAEAVSPPGLIALYAALVSLICKELLFRWTRKRSLSLQSPSLRANAWHHRSDAVSSIPVIIAVFVARYLPDWHFLDSVGGMLVSVLILRVAWKLSRKAIRELSDASAPMEVVERIRVLTSGIEGVAEVHRIRTRSLGNGLGVDLHVLVDGRMSVRAGHDIADAAKAILLEQGPDVVDVVVHVEPVDAEGEDEFKE